MKKKLIIAAMSFLILVSAFAAGVFAASDIKLFVNGKQASTQVEIIDGTSYVPLRTVAEMLGVEVKWIDDKREIRIGKESSATNDHDAVLHFPADKYPKTTTHIQAAIAKGESAVCTIDRAGADENREKSLAGIPTKEGFDRDEWPMAMCAEGGAGADVDFVESSDNRGSGSWVGNELRAYTDGTRILFVIDGSGSSSTTSTPQAEKNNTDVPVFKNCTEVKAAGKAPIHKGDPGFSAQLDRDGDGVACES